MPLDRRHLLGAFAAFALWPAASADARRGRGRGGHDDRDDDHDRASEARQSGEIRPLKEIIEEVQKVFPGEVIGVEFERKNERRVYEIKMLTKTGRYLEVYVDAATKEIIKVEGK